MAENLGQIDVVVKSDDQTMSMPAMGSTFGTGAKDATWIGSHRPDSARAKAGGGRVADFAATSAGMAKFAKVAATAAKVLGIFAIGIVGWVTFFKLMRKGVQTLKKWDAEVQRLVGKFATLNGTAALASAIQRLGEFQRNIRQARAIGPMLLQMTKAREGFLKITNAPSAAFNAVKITVLEAFFRVTADLLQPLIDAFGGLEGLTKAARVCTVALLKLASISMKPLGWLSRIASFFTGGFVGGNILGLVGSTLLSISDRLDDAVNEIKKQTQDVATREDMKAIIDANAMTLGHLEHMTGGLWRHGTQVPLQAATGRTMNPRQWAEREAAKKQRRSL